MVGGILRPHKEKDHTTTARLWWERTHRLGGWLAILMAMATICIGFTMLSDKATGNVLLQVDTYTPPRPAPAPTQGLRHRILS